MTDLQEGGPGIGECGRCGASKRGRQREQPSAVWRERGIRRGAEEDEGERKKKEDDREEGS